MLKKIWKNEKKDRKLELIGLLGVVSGFLLLTLPTLAKASIWFDEAFSAYLIRYDFAKIWHFTSVDVHPPLYYFALKIWSIIFGTSDFGLRSLSVFFGVLTLIFAFYLIKRIFKSTKTALLSIVMLAISPMFVRYSQEIRMYMMVAFLSILTVRAFYEIYLAKNSEKSKKKWRIIFVLSAAAGLWTQYLYGLTIVALWLWRIWVLRKEFFENKISFWVKKLFGEKWLVLNIWIIGLFLPWIPFFITQALSVKSSFWIKDLSFNTIPNYISNFFTFVNSGDLNGWWCLVIFGVVWLLVVAVSRIPKDKKYDFSFLEAMAILPVAVLFLLSLPPFKSIFVDRYALSGMVFAALILGSLVSSIPKKSKKISIALFVLVIASFIYGNYEIIRQSGFSKTSNETTETRQIIERIKNIAGNNEPIVVTSGYFYYEAAQYSTPQNPVFFTGWNQDYRIGSLKMLEEESAHKITDIKEFSKKYSKIWMVYSYGETQKDGLDSSWSLVSQALFKDKLTGSNRYLVQEFSVKK